MTLPTSHSGQVSIKGVVVRPTKRTTMIRKLVRGISTLLSPWRSAPGIEGLCPERLVKIALHEAGHAAAIVSVGRGSALLRASILPHSRHGYGLVQSKPDPHFDSTATRRLLLDMITIKLAGRAAEEVFFGSEEVSVGSSHDLMAATNLAEGMLFRYGFSKTSGFVVFDTKDKQLPPEATAEMSELLASCYDRALKIVEEHREAITTVAQRLIDEGHLDGDALRKCFQENIGSSISSVAHLGLQAA
ncbi:hypothetical protein G6L37_03095 [Agrobacterium rubi]|nr:hypothetical protein [Agrobacterium rubi]NTF24362.1 hypothetical protein [Agrobacterium rubi]